MFGIFQGSRAHGPREARRPAEGRSLRLRSLLLGKGLNIKKKFFSLRKSFVSFFLYIFLLKSV